MKLLIPSLFVISLFLMTSDASSRQPGIAQSPVVESKTRRDPFTLVNVFNFGRRDVSRYTFSPKTRRLYVSFGDKKDDLLYEWDVDKGVVTHKYRLGSGYMCDSVAVSPDGKRQCPFLEVFAGPKATTLHPAELITAVELPALRKRPTRQMFRKIGTRAAQALSKTVAAGLLWLDGKGRVEELRFALGAMAPTVRRLHAAEASVVGRRLTPATVDRAVELLAEDVSPIDDLRSTAAYRLAVSRALLRGFLQG
jgi:hypothetical protein